MQRSLAAQIARRDKEARVPLWTTSFSYALSQQLAAR